MLSQIHAADMQTMQRLKYDFLPNRSFLTSAHCFIEKDLLTGDNIYEDPAGNDLIVVFGGMYNWCLPSGKKEHGKISAVQP